MPWYRRCVRRAIAREIVEPTVVHQVVSVHRFTVVFEEMLFAVLFYIFWAPQAPPERENSAKWYYVSLAAACSYSC